MDSLAVDTTGRASAVCVRGSLYWLTHRDGPSRAISATPGVRVRLPEILGDTGRIAYVTDAEVRATGTRAAALLEHGTFPAPRGEWPAIPWPPF
jgi:hypothetical protein